MTLEEIYRKAKAKAIAGEPLLEIPMAEVRHDVRGRTFVPLKVIVECIQEASK